MQKSLKWTLLIALAVNMTGCSPAVDHDGRMPLVRVGQEFLYKEDLEKVIPVGITREDSVRFAKRYIKNWVEDALLFRQAEDNIPDDTEIEKRVNAYRKALIMHVFQEELVRQELSNEITDAEVELYYRQNAMAFLAKQPYIQGLFVKIPLHASQVDEVRTWYKADTPEAIDLLEKYSIGNAVSYEYFYDRWRPVSDFSAKLPLKEIGSDKDYLVHNRNVEISDTAYHYFLHVENFLPQGELLPLEHVKNEIKGYIINLKRVDFINRMKQDLYDKASEGKDIIYYEYSNE